ncbi:DUF2793 domain-containing protein [Salipiger sp. 1_MG-2023]|uniref:DUF2793 domain-containing protein n=1 Tax=Salipiger sp. 1_MG-2023 TaxID=3062665 RepID=UPI0026E30BEC|nr:DUF2793 domain-containing protein [Salipiger sp. 1_MG-2023]MDO6586875.1 DUF2793 domain-containing protein [Salipiger sp. 1_MG-2023]
MSENTPQLGLPCIQPSQAQKHVTHNEALRLLDTLVQMRLESFGAVTPPASPVSGESHALGTGATGVWTGHDNEIASWDGTAWTFLEPRAGWCAFGLAEAEMRTWSGSVWRPLASGASTFSMLGINATADATNRLSVSADATLLNNAGADHRLVLNKAGGTDTASLLYQSGWTGHAEMGLTGDSSFHLKVSADGSVWTEALVIDAASGLASGAAVQSTATDITPGRLARADYAYGRGNLVGTVAQSGGIPTGAAIESGDSASGSYVRHADGTQICSATVSVAASGSSTVSFAAAFAAAPRVTVAGKGATAIIATSDAASASTVDVYAFDTSGTRIAASVEVIAMGRWY